MAKTNAQTAHSCTLRQIVSGGQTGVDRAALDAAMQLGIAVGGWCPKGRRSADGVIPQRYPLRETRDPNYRTRTRRNVRDSDATLILCRDEPGGGTALTITCCEQLGRPYAIVRLADGKTGRTADKDFSEVLGWLAGLHVGVLNVAGPRETRHRPIYLLAYGFLAGLLDRLPR